MDAYKRIRSRFYESSNDLFGPGFMSMVEYYYLKKTGSNLFSTLHREPSQAYDYLKDMMKGEEGITRLLSSIAGHDYESLIRHIKKNDGYTVWNTLEGMSAREHSIQDGVEKERSGAATTASAQ